MASLFRFFFGFNFLSFFPPALGQLTKERWVSTPEVALFGNQNMIDEHVYDSVSLNNGEEIPPSVAVAVEIDEAPSLPPPRKPARSDKGGNLPALMEETLV